MNLKFTTLCSLIKNIQINTKNDIKRLEYVIPNVIDAIHIHPAHASTLLYYLAKSTSQSYLNSGCATCKGLCKTTFQPISSHINDILDNLSPKALAKILKVYSNCLYDITLSDQIKLRLCYFMLSCMNFPKHYLYTFNEWTKEYTLSPDDYLISLNSSFDHSKFFLPLVSHDVADLVQSISQGLSKHKSEIDRRSLFVLDISVDYLAKLFKINLNEDEVHSVTRIFYFYNECSYFSNNVKELWAKYMAKYIIIMNEFDICTMLHSLHSDLEQHSNILRKVENRFNTLLMSIDDAKTLGMILNGLFKCNIRNTYIADIVYDRAKTILDPTVKPRELMQLIKALHYFDIRPKDLVCLLHSIHFSAATFDLHDLNIILGWYNAYGLDAAHIITILSKIDLSDSKFDSLFILALGLDKSTCCNEDLKTKLTESLKLVYNKNKKETSLNKLVKLYESLKADWIEKEILALIESYDLADCFRAPLIQHTIFRERLKRRCKQILTNDSTLIELLDKLSSIPEAHNFSILPMELIAKNCNLQHLPMLLSHEHDKMMDIIDIKQVIENTKKPLNGLCVYRCIMSGVRGNDAGILIDFFIRNEFKSFKELMMIAIVAGLPNINSEDSQKIADYVTSQLSDIDVDNIDKLKIINKIAPVCLKHFYSLSDRLYSIGITPLQAVGVNTQESHLFTSYMVKLDKYRSDPIISALKSIPTSSVAISPSALASIGLIGMQFWNVASRLWWLRLALRQNESANDFYTPLQTRLLTNNEDYALKELELMIEVVKRYGKPNEEPRDISIINEIEQLECITAFDKRIKIIY